jgi:hypothetical protein
MNGKGKVPIKEEEEEEAQRKSGDCEKQTGLHQGSPSKA